MPDQTPTPAMMFLLILISLGLAAGMWLLRRFGRQRGRSSRLVEAMVGAPEIYQLAANTRHEAIRELASFAARLLRWPDENTIYQRLMKRETEMSTGLVHGIAVPHARFVNLGRSLVIFARSHVGIEWDCIDEIPATMIFLLLTPEEDEEIQIKLLAEIGRCAEDSSCLNVLAHARDCREISKALQAALIKDTHSS